jgi:peptidyl-prolyl cis-trans isomerase B (cyclophilin B)
VAFEEGLSLVMKANGFLLRKKGDFYIVENEEGYPPLDGNYTVFGQTIAGFEVIETIAVQPKDRNNRPLKDIKMWMEVKKMPRRKITKLYGYEFK